jgi:peptide/nickel transport system ATP-binding protein
MRQRVVIAMAIANEPRLLIADEPTTALDVTVQAAILDLVAGLAAESDASVVLITHDLGVIARMAERVAVMYAGRVVESGPVDGIFHQPLMPYTGGLMGAIPRAATDGGRLNQIKGSTPSLIGSLVGCPFAPRCPLAIEVCRRVEPPLELTAPGSDRSVACHRWHELVDTDVPALFRPDRQLVHP